MKRTYAGYSRSHFQRLVRNRINAEEQFAAPECTGNNLTINNDHQSTHENVVSIPPSAIPDEGPSIESTECIDELLNSEHPNFSRELVPATENYTTIMSTLLKMRAEIHTKFDCVIERLNRIEKAVYEMNFKPPDQFPLRTLEKFNGFIATLSNDVVRENTILYFKSISPKTKDVAVKGFRELFPDSLLKEFNWRGEQGKLSFKENELFSLLTNSWNSASLSMDDIEKIFKEELQKSRGRLKAQNRRSKKLNVNENNK